MPQFRMVPSLDIRLSGEQNNTWRWLDPGTAGVHAAFSMWHTHTTVLREQEAKQLLSLTHQQTIESITMARNTARRGQKDEHGNTASGAPLKLGSLPETDTVVLL